MTDDAPEMPIEAPTLPQDSAEGSAPPLACVCPKSDGSPCRWPAHPCDGCGAALCDLHVNPDAPDCAQCLARKERSREASRRGGKTTGDMKRARRLTAEEITAGLAGGDFDAQLEFVMRAVATRGMSPDVGREVRAGIMARRDRRVADLEAELAQARDADGDQSHESMLERLENSYPVASPLDALKARLERMATRQRDSATLAELEAERAELEALIEAKGAEEAARPATGMVALEPVSEPAESVEPEPAKPPVRATVAPLAHWLIRPANDENADAARVWREEHPR